VSDLDDATRELLQKAKRGLSASEGDLARAQVRLQSALAAPGLAAGDAPRPGWTEAARLKSATMGLLLGAALGLAAGYQLGRAQTERATSPTTAVPAEAAPAPRAEPPPAHPRAQDIEPGPASPGDRETAEQPPIRQAASSGPVRAESATPASPDELETVRSVQRALAQGQAALALEYLNELDRTLPGGRLLEERVAARAIADCLLDPSVGKGTYATFLVRYPESVHEKRVARACNGRAP